MDNLITEEVKTLFEFASPSSLRKSVSDVFFGYLMKTDKTLLPDNFDTITADLYFLIDFLNKAEEKTK